MNTLFTGFIHGCIVGAVAVAVWLYFKLVKGPVDRKQAGEDSIDFPQDTITDLYQKHK